MAEKNDAELAVALVNNLLELTIDNVANKIDWQDVEVSPGKKLTADELKEDFKNHLHKTLDDRKSDQRIYNGFGIIMQHLGEYPNERHCLKEVENATQILKSSLQEVLGPNLENATEALSTKIDFDTYEQVIDKLPTSENPTMPPSLAETWKLSLDTLETFYQIGTKLYENEKLEEAISVFSYLSIIDVYNPNVWLSLGMCHHKGNDWFEALKAFTMVNILNPENPLPYLYSIDCYLANHDRNNARASFQLASHFITNENREPFAPLIKKYESLVH